jgi:hypothetical protein
MEVSVMQLQGIRAKAAHHGSCRLVRRHAKAIAEVMRRQALSFIVAGSAIYLAISTYFVFEIY